MFNLLQPHDLLCVSVHLSLSAARDSAVAMFAMEEGSDLSHSQLRENKHSPREIGINNVGFNMFIQLK